MVTVTARPKKDKTHIVVETFASEIVAQNWIALLKKNGWEVL